MSFVFRMRAPIIAATLGLASCQLVSGLGKLETEASGGAGGNTGTGGVGATTTASNASTSASKSGSASNSASDASATGATTSTSTGSSTGMASSSTGTPLDLVPCGNTTDTFATLDANKWTIMGATDVGNAVRASGASYIELKTPGFYDECFTSVRVVLVNANGVGNLQIQTAGVSSQHELVSFDSPGTNVFSDPGGSSILPNGEVTYLGLALHAGKVHYLYIDTGGVWKALTPIARPPWLNTATSTIHVSVSRSACGTVGPPIADFTFTDFNVKPIRIADLPP